MAREKRVHTVEQLLHVFLNGGAMHNHRAGLYAYTADGVLYGGGSGDPAVSFLTDATFEGKSVVAHRYNGKWAPHYIVAATPDQTVHAVHVRNVNRAALMSRSVYTLFDAIFKELQSKLLSLSNAAGERERVYHVPELLHVLRDLLKLEWADVPAHTRSNDALDAFVQEWRIDSKGEYELEYARALAQQKAIVSEAQQAAKKCEDLLQRVEHSESERSPQRVVFGNFEQVLAPLVLANAHGHYSGLIQKCLDAKAKYERLRRKAFVQALLKAESEGRACEYSETSLSDVPAHIQRRFDKYRSDKQNATRRYYALRNVKLAQTTLSAYNAATAELDSLIQETMRATEADVLRDDLKVRLYDASAAFTKLYGEAHRVPERYRRHIVPDTTLQAAEAAQSRLSNVRNLFDQSQVRIRQRSYIAEIVQQTRDALSAGRPRLAAKKFNSLPIAAAADHAELYSSIVAAIAEVSPIQEWENGGTYDSAEGHDGMRITTNGRIRTSRGVEVPIRAVERAIRYVDAQPEGAFECSVSIGSFTMRGRTAYGVIRVGCHTFDQDMVDYIRSAIARHREERRNDDEQQEVVEAREAEQEQPHAG